MAAISRRPRLALIAVLAVSLIAAACSLVKPTETTEDKQEHAARLVHDGKHAEAARRTPISRCNCRPRATTTNC